MNLDQHDHSQRLLASHRSRLRLLQERAALLGISTPPEVLIEIEGLQQVIAELDLRPNAVRRATNSARLYPECPYPGMSSFTREDAARFFGRDAAIQDILGQLWQHHFVCIIGSSGSGKSSMVHAGVIPQLEEKMIAARTPVMVCTMRPGSHPVVALETMLEGSIAEPDLDMTIGALLRKHTPHQRLQIVIDQFEEVFALASREERELFLSSLPAILTRESCAILLVMRSDFYPELLNSDIWPLVQARRYELPLLSGIELQEAIEKPATLCEFTVDPDLRTQLLVDARQHDSAALPFLQEVLVALWWRMGRDRRLTLEDYKKNGGFAAPFISQAERAINTLTPEGQTIARRILLRLLQFPDSRPITRRQLSAKDLRAAHDDPHIFAHTLRHLADQRLLRVDGDLTGDPPAVVDIAHESLIACWPRLAEWIAEWRQAELTRRWVDDKVSEWIALGQVEGGLLDALELRRAEAWIQSSDAQALGYNSLLPNLILASQQAISSARRQAEELTRRIAADHERLRVTSALKEELTQGVSLDEALRIVARTSLASIPAHGIATIVTDLTARIYQGLIAVRSQTEPSITISAVSTEDTAQLLDWIVQNDTSSHAGEVTNQISAYLARLFGIEILESVIAVPLKINQEYIGALCAVAVPKEIFQQEHKILLTAVADQLANFTYSTTLMAERDALISQHLTRVTTTTQSLFQSLEEAVLVLDKANQVIISNTAAEELLQVRGYTIQQYLLYEPTPPNTGDLLQERAWILWHHIVDGLRRSRGTHEPFYSTFSLPERQTLTLTVAPTSIAEPYELIIVLRDVTREAIADQFRHDFITSISHELRTPLTSIKGYVDLLLLGAAGALSEGQMSFLSVVKNNANRLMDLINDILELGRIDSGKTQLNFEQVKLTTSVEEVLQALRHEIEAKTLEVSAKFDSDLPSVEADQRRLTKILFELVKNAIRFTPAHGKIAIYGYLNPSNMLAVDVVDTGIGIAPADQQHVFQRFWRQSKIVSNGEGIGLGLSIAQALVEMHGGAIWLQSTVGVGSKFSFAIPLAQEHIVHEDV